MQTAIIITISVVAILALVIGYAYWKYKRIITQGSVEYNQDVINLNDNNFQNITKQGIVVVDFWAEWCQPCKLQAPIINDIAVYLKGKAKVCNLNVEKNQKTAAKYNVRSIPTIIIFKNGKETNRLVGLRNKNQILKEIEKHF